MLATALVVFREILEASLIVGIVLAACRGIAHRATMALAGVTAGVLGSVVLATAAGKIAEAAAGVGQEILNAAILGATVAMLGWHSVWMSHYGRRMSIQMRAIGHEVAAGRAPVWMLGSVIALAVLREGSEIVLFLYGIAAGGAHRGQMLSGGILGLAGGILVGMILYRGLLRVPLHLFFTVTGTLILFVAAGLASQAAGMLIQAGLIEHFSEPIWDTSQLISDGSLVGDVLHALLGYTARPAVIQVVCYMLTLGIVGGAIVVSSRPFAGNRSGVTMLALALLAGSLVAAAPRPSEAAPYKVYSPHVVRGENEVEYRGFRDVDDDQSVDGTEQHVIALGRGFTDNWFSEIYSVHERDPGSSLRHTGFEWENLFQLTEPGQYWADFGLLLEYEAVNHGNPDELAIGSIFEKAFGPWVATLNLFLEQEVGSGRTSGTTFAYAARVRYLLRPQFEPAVEFFGEPGRIGHFGPTDRQEHWVGPAFYGSIGIGAGKKLGYSASYLFGETSASSDNRAILRLEFEFF